MRFKRNVFSVMTVLVISCVFINAYAVAETDLSEVVKQQAGQISELRSDLAEIRDLAMGSDDSEDEFGTIDIHGFVSQGFMKTTDNNYLTEDSEDGSFQFNEMGINFSTQLSDRVRVGMQLFSRDLGDLGNNEVVLDWAYADYRWQDWLGVRVGRVKMPLGLYNETRDFDMLRTSILLPQSVYDEGLRDTTSAINGISLYGEVSLDALGGLSYQAEYGYLTGTDDGAAAALIEDGTAFNVTDVEIPRSAMAQLLWQTPIDGLRLGVTGGFSDGMTTDMVTTSDFVLAPGAPGISDIPVRMNLDDIETFVLSGEYVVGDWTFNAEYFKRKGDIVTTANNMPVGPGGAQVDNVQLNTMKLYSKGHYVGAARRFNEWLELGSYYSVSKPGVNATKTKDLALSARFDLTEHWIFKLEGHYMDGDSILMINPNPGGTEDDWFMFLAKATFSF